MVTDGDQKQVAADWEQSTEIFQSSMELKGCSLIESYFTSLKSIKIQELTAIFTAMVRYQSVVHASGKSIFLLTV